MQSNIPNLGGCIVFFDFDGVLAPYRATRDKTNIKQEDYIANAVSYRTLPEREEKGLSENTLIDMVNYDIYNHLVAPKTFRDIISSLDARSIFGLTTAATSFELEAKKGFIHKWYPNFLTDNFLFVRKDEYKAKLMQAVYERRFKGIIPPSKMVIVDDSVSILEEAEALGFTAYHNSMFVE